LLPVGKEHTVVLLRDVVVVVVAWQKAHIDLKSKKYTLVSILRGSEH
jgi:hypothetical protein